MEKMIELYQKVAGDKTLQQKFGEILNNAEQAGPKATDTKLVEFAKEAGYDVTLEEMQTFFKELAEKNKDELSEVELDMVAGGKSNENPLHLVTSFIPTTCGATSNVPSKKGSQIEIFCQDYLK